MWWSRWERTFTALARDTAARAFAVHGVDAWGPVYRRSRDLDTPAEERCFFMAVRRELERLVGMPPRVDTATRWTSHNPMFTESKDDDTQK